MNGDSTNTQTSDVASNETMTTPEVSTTTAVTPTASKKSYKKSLMIAISIVVVLAVIFGILAIAKANQGKDNIISRATSFLPLESVPLINKIGKDNGELVGESLSKLTETSTVKNLGGKESKFTFNVNVATEQATMNMNIVGTSAINKSGEQSKINLNIGGSLKSGAQTVDLGDAGVKINVLMPSQTVSYMSFDLSKDLLAKVNDTLEKQGLSSQVNINDFVGKYGKLDLQEYLKTYQSMLTGTVGLSSLPYNSAKLQPALMKLIDKISPDVRSAYGKTLGSFEKHSTVKNEGRTTIAGRTAMTFAVSLDEKKAASEAANFIDALVPVIKNHINDLKDFCKEIEASGCDALKGDEIKNLTATDKIQVSKSFEQLFDVFDIKDLKFYIDPIDNSILKLEGKLALDSKLLSGRGVDKFEFSFSEEEVSRGKDFTVDAPKEYEDLNKLLNEQLKNYAPMLSNPSSLTPSSTNPSKKIVTPTTYPTFDQESYEEYLKQLEMEQ
jgi:hypothetical protein